MVARGVQPKLEPRPQKRRGHVFQGRYKAAVVNGEARDGWYFRIAADYIHLNPVRTGLAGGEERPLSGYRWSSLSHYAKGKGPEWLETSRVLGAFELARDGRGRRAYVAWLEERAKQGGELSRAAMDALRRGWYLAEKIFAAKVGSDPIRACEEEGQRGRTGLRNGWVASRLAMGQEVAVTRAVRRIRETRDQAKGLAGLEAEVLGSPA